MKCPDCQFQENGHTGPDCPMRRAGVRDTFAGGCNLGVVTKRHAEAEKARIAALPDVEFHDKAPAKIEKDLQNNVEGWLANHGYRRMTAPEAACAKRDGIGKGWFFHLYIGKADSKAPLLPDLMIFNSDMTRCLPIELKVVAKFQDGQKEMIDLGAWQLSYTFAGVKEMVEEWEGEK